MKLAKYSMTHQKISLGYPRATFSWYLVPTRDINYVDYVVCQFSAKVSSQVICMRNAQTAPFNAWSWSCVKRWILPRTQDTHYYCEAEGCLRYSINLILPTWYSQHIQQNRHAKIAFLQGLISQHIQQNRHAKIAFLQGLERSIISKKGRTQCRRLPALCGVGGRVVFKPQALPTQMCRGWGSNPGPSGYRR